MTQQDTQKEKVCNIDKRVFRIIILMILLSICVVFMLFLKNKNSSIQIFPDSGYFPILIQSDTVVDGGDSKIYLDPHPSETLSFTYVLGTGYSYPYAGVLISTVETKGGSDSKLDLSKYTHLEIDITSTSPRSEVKIYFNVYADGFTDMERSMSWRVFEKSIPLLDTSTVYRYSLAEFKTPNWWWDLNEITQVDLPKRDLRRCLGIVIENGDYEVRGESISVELRSLRLYRDTKNVNIAGGVLLLVINIIGLLTILVIKKISHIESVVASDEAEKGADKPVVIPYTQLEVSSYADEDAQRIRDFVAANYSNQALLVKDVSKGTGVSQTKIQTILKNGFQMSFRQYLNTIRTHEAKRLLRETDRQVTDIANRVGYKNVTHFNRIFKESEGISPNQYRKRCKLEES